MPLPRLQLFELEDQPWFPAGVRDLTTDYLRFMETKFRLHRDVIPVLLETLRETGVREVVDLCAGGGGTIVEIRKELAAQGMDVRFTLTDRYPNLTAFRASAAAGDAGIDFVEEPVDARAVPESLPGLRTLFNAFHHFSPGEGREILRDAVRAGRPIAVFEVPHRSLSSLLPVFLLTPLFVALTTPFIRPFSWRRILWTYVVPLVPLTCWWDGTVSQLRAYTVDELRRLTEGLDAFAWKAGRVALSPNRRLTYLVGWPRG